jgi:hypothetical protein
MVNFNWLELKCPRNPVDGFDPLDPKVEGIVEVFHETDSYAGDFATRLVGSGKRKLEKAVLLSELVPTRAEGNPDPSIESRCSFCNLDELYSCATRRVDS